MPCALGSFGGVLRRPCPEDRKSISRQKFDAHQEAVYKIFSDMEGDKNLAVAYPGTEMCRTEQCMSSLNGEFLYRDSSHLRRNMSLATRTAFAKLIGLDSIFPDDKKTLSSKLP